MQLSMHFKIALAPILHGIYSIPWTWQKETREHTVGLSVLSTGVWGGHPWILIDCLIVTHTHWKILSEPLTIKSSQITLRWKWLAFLQHAQLARADLTRLWVICWAVSEPQNSAIHLVIILVLWSSLPPHRLSTKQFTTFTFALQERLSGELTGPATSWWRDDLFSLILININRGLVITNVRICMLVSPSKTIRPSAIRNCLSCLTREEYRESEPTKSETFRWRNDQ